MNAFTKLLFSGAQIIHLCGRTGRCGGSIPEPALEITHGSGDRALRPAPTSHDGCSQDRLADFGHTGNRRSRSGLARGERPLHARFAKRGLTRWLWPVPVKPRVAPVIREYQHSKQRKAMCKHPNSVQTSSMPARPRNHPIKPQQATCGAPAAH